MNRYRRSAFVSVALLCLLAVGKDAGSNDTVPKLEPSKEDAGDPDDRNVVHDALGDWRDGRTLRPEAASGSIDIVGADVSVAGASAGALAGRFVVAIELADAPDSDSGAALTYSARFDIDRDGVPDIGVDLDSKPLRGWQARVLRYSDHQWRPLDQSAGAMALAVVHSRTIRLWIDGSALGKVGFKPPFDWSVSARERPVDDGLLVDPDADPTRLGGFFVDEAHGLYPFYPGEGDRLPPTTYIITNGNPVVDRRCAVIVGDNSHGVGPKDAQDFEAALLKFREWRTPRGVIRSIRTGATSATIQRAITALNNNGCSQLLFFYSGHGSNGKGDRKPRDEVGGVKVDEYLSLRNRNDRKDSKLKNARRVFDDDLASWLAQWQSSNSVTLAVPGSQLGAQETINPEILVVLQACYSGGFVGGGNDLDRQLRRYDILMGSRENQKCYGVTPGPNVAVQNSFFVANLLSGMDISRNDRRITGSQLFTAAALRTTADARRGCTRQGGCSQNPQREARTDFVLHSP